MKGLGYFFVALLLAVQPVSVAALSVVPSDDRVVRTAGPFLITEYSFIGSNLRYVQIYNSSSNLATLDGWSIASKVGSVERTHVQLGGMVEPGTFITIGDPSALPSATFNFTNPSVPAEPNVTSVLLIAPQDESFLDETVTPSITTSTPRIVGTPATFHFSRNLSTSTGNYLSTFAAFVHASTHTVYSDELYDPPTSSPLTIVEVFPDSPTCAPLQPGGICSDYVKIRNSSGLAVDLSEFRLRTGAYGQSATNSNTSTLSGMLAPGRYVSVTISLSASGSWVWIEDAYGTKTYDDTLVNYPSSSGNDNRAWGMNPSNGVWQWTASPNPSDTDTVFPDPVPVNECAGVRVSEIAANVADEEQFVELHNITDRPVSMLGCGIQTNRSTTATYVFGDEVISAGGFWVVYIKDTPLTLTKTTSGTVYVISSDKMVEADNREYSNLKADTSWADIQGVWKQTYEMTPGTPNIWTEYPACDAGYYRKLETGKCNKIQPATTLAACATGKYRNPETNRCRTIASASSILTPCKAGQVRNPATNRCRSIVSQASSLKPCNPGQERNPLTNRCRKTTASELKADFPIEAVEAATGGGIAWWAFGGAGILAAGYAGWEWRREAANAIKKAASFVMSGR